MNRKEAINYLVENPNKRVRMIKEVNGWTIKGIVNVIMKNGTLVFEDYLGYAFPIYVENDKAEFVVGERKLRRMCFGEMVYIFYKEGIHYGKCKSVVTGEDFGAMEDAYSLEELTGEWTIEGKYEDE